jgi:hypothetical protein
VTTKEPEKYAIAFLIVFLGGGFLIFSHVFLTLFLNIQILRSVSANLDSMFIRFVRGIASAVLGLLALIAELSGK